MTDQARVGIEKLESLTGDAQILNPLRAAVESAGKPPDETEPVITEINAGEPADFEVAIENQHASEIAALPDLMAGYQHQTHDESHMEVPAEITSETAFAESHSAEPAGAEALTAESNRELTALVADLEASLGDSFPQAQSTAAELPESQPSRTEPSHTPDLQGWPVSSSPDAAETPEPEPVASASSTDLASTSISSTRTQIEVPLLRRLCR